MGVEVEALAKDAGVITFFFLIWRIGRLFSGYTFNYQHEVTTVL